MAQHSFHCFSGLFYIFNFSVEIQIIPRRIDAEVASLNQSASRGRSPGLTSTQSDQLYKDKLSLGIFKNILLIILLLEIEILTQ